jgi:hypothetical protein
MACLPWWRLGWLVRITGEEVQRLTQWAVDEPVVVTTHKARIGWRWWGLPRQDFATTTMLEWDLAHRALVAAKGTPSGLLQFSAHVVRPLRSKKELRAVGFDGDIRLPFNGWHTERYAEQLRVMSPATLALVAEVFIQGHAELVARHPRLFKKHGGAAAAPLEIINMVARDGNFGTFEKVCQQTVEVVLLDMEQHLRKLEDEQKLKIKN